MTPSSDSGGDMRDEQPLDDPLLTDFFTELRSWGSVEPPVPTEALATLLAADDPIEPVRPVPAGPARRKNMLVAKLAGLGIAAKIALGAGVAAAAVTTAGATGVLPGPAQHGVAVAVNAISPLEFPDLEAKVRAAADESSDVTLPTTTIPGNDGVVGDDDPLGDDTGTDDEAKDNHGACVSEVAKDKGLTGREHGQAVSAIAKSDCGKEDETPSSTTTTSTTSTTPTLPEGDETGETAGNGGNSSPGNSGGNGHANSGKGNSGKP